MLTPQQHAKYIDEVAKYTGTFREASLAFETASGQLESIQSDVERRTQDPAGWEELRRAVLLNAMRTHCRRNREGLKLQGALEACRKAGVDPRQQVDDQLISALESLELENADD